MLKKFGMVSVGVTAGLLAVAPMASADEGHHGSGHHGSSHHGSGDQEGTGNIKCSAEGGDIDNDATGDAIGQVAGPVASGNTGQAFSCNSFFNDFLNDNEVNVLSAP